MKDRGGLLHTSGIHSVLQDSFHFNQMIPEQGYLPFQAKQHLSLLYIVGECVDAHGIVIAPQFPVV